MQALRVSFSALFLAISLLANPAAVAQENSLQTARETLRQQGFESWRWMKSDCLNCDVVFLPLRSEVQTQKVQAFMRALSEKKAELMSLYAVHGEEYNLLAHMAVGILGRESLFFESRRYQIKEAAPGLVRLLKVIQIYIEGADRDPSPNSRGPTQIKVIPPKIAQFYNITVDELYRPENAAVATMGFLIEALGELKRRVVANHLHEVKPETYVDYLPYIYFGSTRFLINHQATPAKNAYVRQMKTYMSWVEVYERTQSTAIPLR